MTAVVDGACDRTIHSIRNSAPLTAKDAGTRAAGAIRRAVLALAMTIRIEHSEGAISIAGNADRSSDVRNSASRTAFPLTNWAVTAAAPIIAGTTDADVPFVSMRFSHSPAGNATYGPKPRNSG